MAEAGGIDAYIHASGQLDQMAQDPDGQRDKLHSAYQKESLSILASNLKESPNGPYLDVQQAKEQIATLTETTTDPELKSKLSTLAQKIEQANPYQVNTQAQLKTIIQESFTIQFDNQPIAQANPELNPFKPKNPFEPKIPKSNSDNSAQTSTESNNPFPKQDNDTKDIQITL